MVVTLLILNIILLIFMLYCVIKLLTLNKKIDILTHDNNLLSKKVSYVEKIFKDSNVDKVHIQ